MASREAIVASPKVGVPVLDAVTALVVVKTVPRDKEAVLSVSIVREADTANPFDRESVLGYFASLLTVTACPKLRAAEIGLS